MVAQLKDKGAIVRGFLGVHIEPLTKEIATSVGLEKPEGDTQCTLPSEIPPDVACEVAKVEREELILAVFPALVAGAVLGRC